MKTFRELDVYPRILLIVMLVMLLAFSVAYPLTISRVGFQYRGEILVPQVQENQTVYSGRVNGQKASFTVTSDGTITCRMGDKAYGPYTFREEVSNYTKAKSGCSGAALRTETVNAGRMTEMEIGISSASISLPQPQMDFRWMRTEIPWMRWSQA